MDMSMERWMKIKTPERMRSRDISVVRQEIHRGQMTVVSDWLEAGWMMKS
jgi:hypothetical protein